MSLSEKMQTLSSQNAEKSANNVTIAENVPKVYDAGKINFGRKKSVSGEVLHLDDINPNKHSVGGSVESKNVFNVKLANVLYAYATGIKYNDTNYLGNDSLISVLPNTTYKINVLIDGLDNTSLANGVLFYDASKNYVTNRSVSEGTFTTTSDCSYLALNMTNNMGTDWVNHDILVSIRKNISDWTQVNVTACEKNLFNLNGELNSRLGWTTGENVLVDGKIKATSDYTNGRGKGQFIRALPNTTYAVSYNIDSMEEEGQTALWACAVNANNVVTPLYLASVRDVGAHSYNIVTLADTEYIWLSFNGIATSGKYVIYDKVQLELAPSKTDYKPYNATTYTPNADGIVEGITSISPIMNIFTDTAGVVINADYYQDVERFNEDSAWSDFWDEAQQNGERTHYSYAFAGRSWTDDNFKPKYDIILTGSDTTNMFLWSGISDLTEHLNKRNVVLDTSGATELTAMFQLSLIKRVPTISVVSAGVNIANLFWECYNLKEVEKLIFKDDGSQPYIASTSMFSYCINLSHIEIGGKIGYSISFQHSPLDKASITSIINALFDTATGQTLTLKQTAVTNAFGSTTADEWTALVATKQNWTISLV